MDWNGLRVPPSSIVVRGVAQGAVTVGKTVSVKFSNGTAITCLAARDLVTAAGDVVIGMRDQGQIIITARLFAAAPSAPSEADGVPDPEPTTRVGETVIAPVETRSWRDALGGWRTDNDDVYQGEFGSNGNHIGCAFYGKKPRSLAGVEVTRAWIKVKRVPAGQFAHRLTTLKRTVQKTRPAGVPSFVAGTTDGPDLAVGDSENFDIPNSWAQALVDGTAGGLAIHDSSGSPYVRLAGRGSWSPAWVLTIQWKRVT